MTTEPDDALEFVKHVLATGLMLVDVLSLLLDDVPHDAFPGEEPAEVLVEMVAGSFRPAAEAIGPNALREATALVGALVDRTLCDLRTAADLAAEREE
jgi:hypothetical protein